MIDCHDRLYGPLILRPFGGREEKRERVFPNGKILDRVGQVKARASSVVDFTVYSHVL